MLIPPGFDPPTLRALLAVLAWDATDAKDSKADVADTERPSLKLIGERWHEAWLTKHGELARHMGEILNRWERFCNAVGGKAGRVDALIPADFRTCIVVVAKRAASESGKLHNDLGAAPKPIIDRVRRRWTSSWARFPG